MKRFLAAEKRHEEKVLTLQKALKEGGERVSQSKGFSNELNSKDYKAQTRQLDFSNLDEIIAFDEKELIVWVEPKISFAKLVDATLKWNLIPKVVPEFLSITVGGAIMGGALESSSFEEGYFNDTCEEMELLLGNGERIMASQHENADLFFGIASSFGTIAILTLVAVRLKRAKPFVHLSMERFFSLPSLLGAFQKKKEAELIDAVALTPHIYLGLFGKMCEKKGPATLLDLGKFHSPWYIQHLTRHADSESYDVLIPIKQYLFRYDRGAFWMGKYLLSIPHLVKGILHMKQTKGPQSDIHSLFMGNKPSWAFRALWGWNFSSKRLYGLWHNLPKEHQRDLFFIHDFMLPWDKCEKLFYYLLKRTEIFPIWLCPVRGTMTPQFLSPHFGSFSFLNVGLYGITPGKKNSSLLGEIEGDIVQAGGRKMLYSYTSLKERDFWEVYNEEKYERLRKKFYAENRFLSLYNKVSANGN